MTPEHLSDYRQPSDPRLAPDGVQVAFVVTQMDLAADRYVRRIWLWDGLAAKPLTAGPTDTTPRWSPDGSRLAFLRKGPGADAVAQVAMLPMSGGEASVVTEFTLGVREVEWAPGGDRLAVVATTWTDEYAGLDDDERKRRPRRISRLPYRGDNAGWAHDRRSHVYLVDPAGESDPVCLTPGAFDESAIVWHPNGSEIAFVGARHDERGLDAGTQVWRVPVAGGDPVAATVIGLWGHPSYNENGTLHAIGTPDRWDLVTVRRLHELTEPGAEVERFRDLDRNLETFSPPVTPAGPQWLTDGSALSTLEDGGRIRVVRLHPDGTSEPVVGGDRLITGVTPRPDGSVFAFTATSPIEPGELWWWDGQGESQLTDLNGDYRAAFRLVEPEPFSFEMDGMPIEGWVYLPDGDAEVPLLLNIHGGPATQYGLGFFDEFQVYASAGYGVVAINPRGSSGYGHDHVHAIVGRWSDEMPPDMADLLKAIEVAAERFPRLDGERLGIMGGSYGGLATVRLLSLDQRFRSAVAERGLYSWPSFHGTSDIGSWFTKIYLGVDMADDADQVWAASPLAYSSTITTPTLIIHSAGDLRAPIEQGEQLFVRLLQHGVDTELIRFPDGEGHELSRSGDPKHRFERFAAILDWHARHLK